MCTASKYSLSFWHWYFLDHPLTRVFRRQSGVTDHYAHNDEHALSIARSIVSSLNYSSKQPPMPTEYEEPLFGMEDINSVIPSDPKKNFDVRKIIARIADGSRFQEFKAQYGTTMVTGFMNLYGMQVGIVANNGILYSESALKVRSDGCLHTVGVRGDNALRLM